MSSPPLTNDPLSTPVGLRDDWEQPGSLSEFTGPRLATIRSRAVRLLRLAARGVRILWLGVGVMLALGASLEVLYRVEGSLHAWIRALHTVAAPPDLSVLVREEAARSAEHVAWRPYLYYARLPFTGRYVTVDGDGLRHTVSPLTAGSPPAARVFVFGGSPVWGTNLPDSSTIPSLIARDLAAAGRPAVAVRNYGAAGYTITQEIVQLMLALRAGDRPNVVVFYDGYNDVAAGLSGYIGATKDEAGRARDFDNGRILYAPGDDVATDTRVVEEVARLALGRSQLLTRLLPPAHVSTPMSDSAVVDGVSRMFLASRTVIDALARQYGFVPVFAWMPLLDASVKRLSATERRIVAGRSPADRRFEADFQRVRRRVAALARASGQQAPWDVAAMLAHDSTTDFVDDLGHTSATASARIADSLASRIAQTLGRGVPDR